MGYQASITQDALIIADLIHEYARCRGWNKKEYHIFMRSALETYRLSIVLIAKAAEGRTDEEEVRDFDDIVDLIELKARPRFRSLYTYNLVIKGPKDKAFYPYTDLKPDEFAIDERLLNFGVSWTEPDPPRATRGAQRSESRVRRMRDPAPEKST
jgi:hypothetical protein